MMFMGIVSHASAEDCCCAVHEHTALNVMQAEQEAFDHAWADFGQQHSASTAANSSNHPYQFHPNNPYDGNPDALALAQQAFKEGSLQDACLALEAVVKANPGIHMSSISLCIVS